MSPDQNEISFYLDVLISSAHCDMASSFLTEEDISLNKACLAFLAFLAYAAELD